MKGNMIFILVSLILLDQYYNILIFRMVYNVTSRPSTPKVTEDLKLILRI